MKLSSFRYVVPEAFMSIRRNLLTTVSAVITVTIALFLCGMFSLLVLNIDANASAAISELEVIAYLNDSVTPVERVQIEINLKKLEYVDVVTFISKEEALAQIDSRLVGTADSLAGENPLPASFSLTALDPMQVPLIAAEVEKMDCFFKVRYGEGTAETLLLFTETLRKAGLAVMILLGFSAIVLISMGTRISVYSRQKEIMVMKWMGSTNAFIRWPFLLEGILIGFFGALLSLVVCYLLYNQVALYVSTALPFMMFMSASGAVMGIAPVMLSVGILMGGLGSSFSVARFLKV